MRKRLMVCAVAASAALFAEDVTSHTYGVLAVSDSTVSNLVVGVPWRNVSEAETMTDITLSNLVSTATLANDDIVYLYEGTTWYGYKVTEGVLDPMTTVNGQTVTPTAADAKTLSRGTGLIVQRASNTTPIYLCGRYDETTPGSTTIPANATTLIANPKTVTVSITDGTTGDQIRIPGNGGKMTVYEKRADGWYGQQEDKSLGFPVVSYVKLADGVPLAAGKGAFYLSKGARTISW